MSSTNTEVATKNDVKNTAIEPININSNEALTQAFAAAKSVSTEHMIKETGNYLQLEEGESYLLLVKGLTIMEDTINNTGDVDCVDLVTEEGDAAINADVVFVSTVKRLIEKNVVPCIVYVFCKGKKGKAGAMYKDLDIRRVPTTA